MKQKFAAAFALLCCVILAFFIVSSNQELLHMTRENAQDYTKAFMEAYNQQVENNFRLEYRKYFDFYANFPYNVNATASSAHGISIEFVASNESSFDFRIVEQRIELVVFPDVDLNITSLDVNATVFIWHGEPSQAMLYINGTGNVICNIIFITNKGHFLDLGIGGSILLLNVNVDGRYYYLMVIKGSNKPISWAKNIAKEDARILFEEDLFHAFNKSQEIREYMAYPILEELISQIVWKHQHAEETGYDMLQYYEDLTRVRDIAVNTYHLNSTFVDGILNWLEGIYPKQPWWEIAPYSWLLGAVIGFLVTILLGRVYKALKLRWQSYKLSRHQYAYATFTATREKWSSWFRSIRNHRRSLKHHPRLTTNVLATAGNPCWSKCHNRSHARSSCQEFTWHRSRKQRIKS